MKFLPNCIFNNYKILMILDEFKKPEEKLSSKLLFQHMFLELLIYFNMVQLIILHRCNFTIGYFIFASLDYNFINVMTFF